ncbi:hypothetical protein [Chitinibacter sp. S2-10]|uniref:zinc ribbon domain-containing protein n=1 Tax=Chitinibacter sp. S2-10 TaxID=3373597 RepID=UPI003977C470
MAKFCRGCGCALEEGARFCGECGTAVASAAQAALNPLPSTSAIPRKSGRGVIIASLIGTLLIAGGTGAWWFNRPENLNEAVFLREMRHLIAQNQAQNEKHFCLNDGINYSQTEIQLRDYDNRSRQWFDMLASHGLYTPAQQKVVRSYWSSQTYWIYQQTEQGKAAVRENRLCYAKESELTKATFSPATQIGQYQIADGIVSFQARNLASWSQTDVAKTLAPEIARNSKGDVNLRLVLVEGKWQAANPELSQQIRNAELEQQKLSQSNPLSGGWLDSLLGLFKSGSTEINPLYGQWETETILGQELNVTLESDAIMIMGERTGNISYVPRKDSDWVRVKNPQGITLIELRVIDADTLEYRLMGMMQGKMYRSS